MNSRKEALEKLVQGAQMHVKGPGHASAKRAERMAAFTEYEIWREQHLAVPAAGNVPKLGSDPTRD